MELRAHEFCLLSYEFCHLALDGDLDGLPAKSDALKWLRDWTGQDFGEDRDKWWAWVNANRDQLPEEPPLPPPDFPSAYKLAPEE